MIYLKKSTVKYTGDLLSFPVFMSFFYPNTSLMGEREKILFVSSVIINTSLFLSGDIVVNFITEYNG